MPKKTVFSRPTADESHSRNAFDRSFISNVNFPTGMLVPTFCQFVFGHSHVRLNQRSFFRTSQASKPAFPQLPMYTDYFYVPMHQLISSWNAFRTRTNDRFSSRIGLIQRLPALYKSDLTAALDAKANAGDHVEINDSLRLLDLLDYGVNKSQVANYGTSYSAGDFADIFDYGALSPLKLCAYQKVYYDHYRNTAYEVNDVQAYNLDDMYTLSGDNESSVYTWNTGRVEKLLEMHYVNYRRDLLNTIYPSLNFTAIAYPYSQQTGNQIPTNVVQGYVSDLSRNEAAYYTPWFSQNFVNIGASVLTPTVSNGNMQLQLPMSTSAIRASFALEKLLRVSAFTPQHVKDQFKARFGYMPKSSTLNESVRLGSFKNDIILGEVTSTASTTISGGVTTMLGAVGAKGVGASDYGKPISYDVPEDGFIIALSYVLPTMTYDSNRIDPINQQFTPEDWSLPEYENLGLQPILQKNVKMSRLSTDTDATMRQFGNVVLGYQPRDMQFKASVSENHGLFNVQEDLSSFVTHGKLDFAHGNVVNASYFKCVPTDVNALFVDAYDGTEESDHFFGCINHQFACIMDKPIFGVPNL